MKKYFKHISLIFAILLTLTLNASLFVNPSRHSANATGTSTLHLQSPSKMAVASEDIFIYDNETECIIKRSKSVPQTGNTCEIQSSLDISGLVDLESTESGLIALTTNLGVPRLTLISSDSLSTTDLDIAQQNYPLELVVDISYDNNTLYFLKSIGEIDCFTISGDVLSRTDTLTKSNFGGSLASQAFKHISHKGNVMFLHTNIGVIKLDLTTHEYFLVLEDNFVSDISFESENCYALSANKILYNISPSLDFESFGLDKTYSSLTSSSDGKAYLSSPSTHQVFEYNPNGNTLLDLLINETVYPSLFNSNNIRFITTTSTLGLYLQPYSVKPKQMIESGTHLTIIGESPIGYDEEFFYCLLSTNAGNQYLYLKKSESAYTEQTITSSLSDYVAIKYVKVYSYPSSDSDTLNLSNDSIAPQSKLFANSEIISNGIESFYRIKLANGEYGFAPSSSLQPLKSAVELTLKCNAKTKRITTLTENADGTGAIITLEKNTRVFIQEEITPNKKYILASYEDPQGITYTGYLFTEDIDPDGLSTLQILGLILIIINLLVLALIVIIKIKSKKWKNLSAQTKN